jgi:tRNA uridine 5-carboxymethylaminomethyl modification enzyme
LSPNQAAKHGIKINQDGRKRDVFDLLSLPDVRFAEIAAIWPEFGDFAADVVDQLEIEALYAGYLDRQQADIVAFQRDEGVRLSSELPYDEIVGLSAETRQRLLTVRPTTIGQAGRIEGVTPAALAVVLAWVKKDANRRAS